MGSIQGEAGRSPHIAPVAEPVVEEAACQSQEEGDSSRLGTIFPGHISELVLGARTAERSLELGRVVRLKGDHAHTSIGLRILKAVANFFCAIWSSITLALTKEDQNWRKYEKYHFLADQTLQGLDTTLRSLAPTETRSKGLYSPDIRERMLEWKEEALRAEEIPKPAKGGKNSAAVGKFHLQKAINCLHKAQSAADRSVDCRDLYKEFLFNLRKAMDTEAYSSSKPSDSPSTEEATLKALANELCYAMYTQANMTGFTKSLVSHVLGESAGTSHAFDPTGSEQGGVSSPVSTPVSGDEIDLSESPRVESPLEAHLSSLSGMYSKIKDAADSKKINPATKVGQSIRGELRGLGFDPHMQGNPPYRKFDVTTHGRRVVSDLRISTPTVGSQINPEFKGYLRALAERGERHMYINLQRSHGGNAGENERSQALHALSRDPEFSRSLSVVTLDKNTSFYSQSGDFAQLKAREFKEEFCKRFVQEESGFYIPSHIESTSKEAIQDMLKDVLDGLHANFFGGREDLSVEERQNMIELAYTIMISRFVEMAGARYYNNSCKDCIDRGGGANALMAYTLTALQGTEPTQAGLSLLPAMTYSDAIWARKREIIHERLERALGAAEALLSAPPAATDWLRSQMAFATIEHLPVLEQNLGP